MAEQLKLGKIDPQVFINAIEDPNVPKVYANGFLSGLGNGDTTIVFQCNAKPTMVLNMSFTLAKTLAIKIGQMINDIEENSENSIMTTDEISVVLEKKRIKDEEQKK